MAVNIKKIINRYSIVIAAIVAIGILVVGMASYKMFVQDDFWMKVAERYKRDSIPLSPFRGSILSSDGSLLSSTLPEYTIFMDFKADGLKDTMITKHMPEITSALHELFPDKSKSYFKGILKNGLRSRGRHVRLYPKRISFLQLRELQSKYFFNQGSNVCGLHTAEYKTRKRFFGTMAERVIGDVYKDLDKGAINGIEYSFNKELKGKNGYGHRERIRRRGIENKFTMVTDVPPENGSDIMLTIDVEMQDIVEETLRNKLSEIGAEYGVAILMEAKTGDIKAVSNLGKVRDSVYSESAARCYAFADLMEPGSTFKTASMMVGLDDGLLSVSDQVDTGNGEKMMHGRRMTDHNRRRGGYGVLDFPHIMMYSSNIGVSTLIDDHYFNQKQKFVDGLKRIGILEDMKLPMKEYLKPKLKSNWDKTTLAWLSIGYNVQLPAINTVAFYNAIANDGVMMRPRLVKAIMKEGKVVQEFPPEIIREKICSENTLKAIRSILHRVVNEGLGKPAGNSKFGVSGKTGTAMLVENGFYRNDLSYVSFCGFFPSDKPLYTCFVAIKKRGFAAGGLMAGDVVGRIAERIYAKHLNMDIKSAIDSNAVFTPYVLKGNARNASTVLNAIGIPNNTEQLEQTGNSAWASTSNSGKGVAFHPITVSEGLTPDVRGMGAKDAVFLLEKSGLKVTLKGAGVVKTQSIAPGSKVKKGKNITIELN